MHRKQYLDEAEQIVNIIYNLTVEKNDRKIVFGKICEPYCESNTQLFKTFKQYFDDNYESALRNHYYSELYNLSYPIGKLWIYRLPLEMTLHGVKLVTASVDNDNNTKGRRKGFFGDYILINPNATIENQITNMEHVSIIYLQIHGLKNTSSRARDLSTWELGLYEWSKNYNQGDSLVKVLLLGNEVLDVEILAAHTKLAPYFGAGSSSMFTFVAFCVFTTAYYYGALDFGKILIGIGAAICPLLAITSTFGFVALVGTRINSFLFVMPFLIFGVGIDAAFLMVSSWQKLTKRRYTSSQRLALTYEKAAPSVAVTSVTNVVSFAVGAITPTPDIRIFCFGTSVAMGLTFVYQLILLGPMLSLADPCEQQRYTRELTNQRNCEKIKTMSQALLHAYSSTMKNRCIDVTIVTITFFYWALCISGVVELRSKLDATKILPKDSLLHEANTLMSDIVWTEVFIGTFFVNSPFDITNEETTTQFWNMLQELEELPRCRGYKSSYVWFRDFVEYSNGTKEIYPYGARIKPKDLKYFLSNNRYHFEKSVRLSKNSNSTVNKFFFTVAYTNISDWSIRIDLMIKWREIVDRYPQLNVTVYEHGGMFVDQMLSLKKVTLQTALLTFLSMTVVCAIFMRNLCAVALASLSIASISTGVIGIMSKLSFELDPIVMACILMTIGMSVDYVAHVAYHYQLPLNKREGGESIRARTKDGGRLEYTMNTVAWPMIQAGLSTISCVLPLLFVATYSSVVFVTAILLVVSLGLLHGLIILPAILLLLPDYLINNVCCKKEHS
ncbi:unnamed protein product [Cylicocyclus nassatus]|uniref:SSD domain-containing protein n=1 Tax=Cylicocyclus nassatus TaxID=53992 RepID=A0AA36GR50_CYLNA|nr:unnamed protein product [Cylicocyclus nassatus]